jgi:hypothetical protein
LVHRFRDEYVKCSEIFADSFLIYGKKCINTA